MFSVAANGLDWEGVVNRWAKFEVVDTGPTSNRERMAFSDSSPSFRAAQIAANTSVEMEIVLMALPH
jgi:hypothetical protein